MVNPFMMMCEWSPVTNKVCLSAKCAVPVCLMDEGESCARTVENGQSVTEMHCTRKNTIGVGYCCFNKTSKSGNWTKCDRHSLHKENTPQLALVACCFNTTHPLYHLWIVRSSLHLSARSLLLPNSNSFCGRCGWIQKVSLLVSISLSSITVNWSDIDAAHRDLLLAAAPCSVLPKQHYLLYSSSSSPSQARL